MVRKVDSRKTPAEVACQTTTSNMFSLINLAHFMNDLKKNDFSNEEIRESISSLCLDFPKIPKEKNYSIEKQASNVNQSQEITNSILDRKYEESESEILKIPEPVPLLRTKRRRSSWEKAKSALDLQTKNLVIKHFRRNSSEGNLSQSILKESFNNSKGSKYVKIIFWDSF